ADRYALAFVPLTLAVAGIAWLLSGEAVRALAVLVVATPCPLILAAPVAIVAGISRAARRGIVVKSGGALERLAAGRVLLFDKTGTLTAGTPERPRYRPWPARATSCCAWPPRSTRSPSTCSPARSCGRPPSVRSRWCSRPM
ncbi:MAG TPA: hypothetical protein VL330_12055, partial [Actinomycetes bacterium]|nr:hypothetical protein [Actinomycetes bacterium]